MTRTFAKPALAIAEQLALLQRRGLIVENETEAIHALTHISYYRLRAYWLYFERDCADGDHGFRPRTTFGDVLRLYDFDRKLRLLINDGIERIEVAVRGSWAHLLALRYGPHGYLDPSLYARATYFARNLTQLEKEIARSHDVFIEHYHRTYGDPPTPPVWMVAEVMSFGLLSKWLSSLKNKADRNAVARQIGLSEAVMDSFLHHLVTVRNICAHHGRLWNRRLTVTTKLPAHPPMLADSVNPAAPRQLYNTLSIMLHVMAVIAPASEWRRHLLALLHAHPTGDLAAMGFPGDWQFRPLWGAGESPAA